MTKSDREIETEFENTVSGAKMGSNHEKKLEVENLVTKKRFAFLKIHSVVDLCKKNKLTESGICTF